MRLPWLTKVTGLRWASVLAAVVGVLICWLLLEAGQEIRLEPVGGDARQNLHAAYNLVVGGTYGFEENPAIPGYRREPLPNLILASVLSLSKGPGLPQPFSRFLADPGLLEQALKVNLLYALMLFAGLWWLCWLLFRPPWLAHIVAMGVLLGSWSFLVSSELENFKTELPAAAFFVLSAVLLVLARRRPGAPLALLAGSGISLVLLTKASGQYVCMIAVPVILVLIMREAQRRHQRPFVCATALLLGICLFTVPWMTRNFLLFNDFALARGGADVLLIRASYNKMTADELRGAFYAFSPERLREDLFEPFLGFAPSQLECDGSLQRFTRNLPCDQRAITAGRLDEVVSFYQVGKRVVPAKLKANLPVDQLSDQENALKKIAVRNIQANSLRHLLVTPAFLWKGIWSFAHAYSWSTTILNGVAMLSLVFMPLLGLWLRKPDWILISLLPAGYFLFYGLSTHFLIRYSAPLIPLSLVALALLLHHPFASQLDRRTMAFGDGMAP